MRLRIFNCDHSKNIKHYHNAVNYESPTEIVLFFSIFSIDMNALTGKNKSHGIFRPFSLFRPFINIFPVGNSYQ
jgi:hypothetical protein